MKRCGADGERKWKAGFERELFESIPSPRLGNWYPRSKRVFSFPPLDSPNNWRPTLRNVDWHSVAEGRGGKCEIVGIEVAGLSRKNRLRTLRGLRRIFFLFFFLRMKRSRSWKGNFLIQACTSWPSFGCYCECLGIFYNGTLITLLNGYDLLFEIIILNCTWIIVRIKIIEILKWID